MPKRLRNERILSYVIFGEISKSDEETTSRFIHENPFEINE
ncbi:hypothetical protein C7S14_0740 [Burkholderia cepacia]|nr:hypothetical protein C7S14_0740 [Burkholderia cepacia]